MNPDITVERATHLLMVCDSLIKQLAELVDLAGDRYGLLSTTDVFQLGVATGVVHKAKASVVVP